MAKRIDISNIHNYKLAIEAGRLPLVIHTADKHIKDKLIKFLRRGLKVVGGS